MSDDWFVTEEIDESTFLICEPLHVNSFLIVGSERAVLLDTGMGVGDIGAAARHLTDRPVLVVNSHHHFDHVGGNAGFEDIAIHESGADLLAEGPRPGWVTSYWAEVSDFLAGYQLEGRDGMRPVPDTFDTADPTFTPSVATRLLADGDLIDLGDRSLRVIHTPGHSQDSICLLDGGHRLLFSADTVDSGTLYVHLPTASVADLATSVGRLVAEVATGVDAVLGAHSADYRNEPGLVARLASDLGLLLAGDVDLEPTTDCFGHPAQQAHFDDVTLVVPTDYAPAGASAVRSGADSAGDR